MSDSSRYLAPRVSRGAAKSAPLTTVLVVLAIGVSLGYLWLGPDSWPAAARWGYLPAVEIWRGKVWPLWTTAFLHGSAVHLAFSMLWLWQFGSHLEPYLGRAKFSVLCALATFVTSSAQLAASDDTGIGMSGLVYALFGYAWASPRDERLAPLLVKPTVLVMFGWLVVCLVVTWTGLYDIGNAAHLAGVSLGALLGVSERAGLRTFGRIGVLSLCLGSIAVLFWCPWSPAWIAAQGP